MLVYLFNINITITKVCVLSVFRTYLNIVINYKVVSKWNQPIIIVMGNSYCVIGDIYECCTQLVLVSLFVYLRQKIYIKIINPLIHVYI